MQTTISSLSIRRQIYDVYRETKQSPILIHINDQTYAIGTYNPLKNDMDIDLTLAERQVVPQTKYDADNWTDDLVNDESILEFSNGYLILTENGYQFTPYMYHLGENKPVTPNTNKTTVDVSLLLNTEQYVMQTDYYATLSIPREEWEHLSQKSSREIIDTLLKHGKMEETYSDFETGPITNNQTTLIVNGEEQTINIEHCPVESFNDFLN